MVSTDILQLKRMIELKPTIDQLAEEECLNITENEWRRLREILKILRHSYDVFLLLQRANSTLSDFYAAWLEMQYVLEEIAETNDDALAKAMIDAMCSKKHESFIRGPLLQSSVFLDPRVKNLLLCESEQNLLARMNLTKVYERFLKPKDNTLHTRPDAIEHLIEKVASYANLTKRLSTVKQPASNIQDDNSSDEVESPTISQHLESFSKVDVVNMCVPVFEYWESNKSAFPVLYGLAKIVYSVPITTISMNKTLSALEFVLTQLNGNFANTLIEDIAIIKANADLFHEVASEELGAILE